MLLFTLACASNPYDTAPLSALTPPALGEGTFAPDFDLEDVNTSSPSFGEAMGPDDAIDAVSAWYFGHAT